MMTADTTATAADAAMSRDNWYRQAAEGEATGHDPDNPLLFYETSWQPPSFGL
jgi:hypothetical protein